MDFDRRPRRNVVVGFIIFDIDVHVRVIPTKAGQDARPITFNLDRCTGHVNVDVSLVI
jgi:hypothetical protein